MRIRLFIQMLPLRLSRIMEALNLLRFLLLRDLRTPVSQFTLRRSSACWHPADGCSRLLQAAVWEELHRIKDDFLQMLRVSISLSRNCYSAELKALREERRLAAKGGSGSGQPLTLQAFHHSSFPTDAILLLQRPEKLPDPERSAA